MEVNEVLKDIAKPVGTVPPDRPLFEIDCGKIRNAIAKLKEVYGEKGIYVSSIVVTDYLDKNVFELSYFIHIVELGKTIVIRTYVDRADPKIASIVDIAPSAYPHELEAYDLFGINFVGNPFLRRGFLVPEDVVEKGVYPLRKDAKV